MMASTTYQIRRLGHLLKTGKAWIDGKTCDGAMWPEGNHYWIIQDGIEQLTWHVLVCVRPTWAKYYDCNVC